MCTLILAYQVDVPIRLYSSRDERLDRPSSRPKFWGTQPEIFAPKDELAGGTWLGTNEHKLVVAITNRFGEPRSSAKRSRGEIVKTSLEMPNAENACSWAQSIDPTDFNPFHVMLADPEHAAIVWSDGSSINTVTIEPGWSVLTEQSFDAADDQRRTWLLSQLDDDLEKARQLLQASSKEDPFSRPKILVPELSYGTRSNAFITVRDDVVEFEYVDEDGEVCVTPFHDS